MNSCESFLIIVTVEGNVIRVLSGKLLHHLVDVIHAAGTFTHRLSGEVGVATRSVPVLEELGGEGDGHIEVLSNALKKVTRDPEVVAHRNTLDWTYLIFPLTWHNFGVSARHFDARVQACPVVSVSDDSAETIVGSNGAVVGALRSRVAIVRPA